VPDVSPIDLLQLSQDINDHPETKDCTLNFPHDLNADYPSELMTSFVTSFKYSRASGDSQGFLLSMEIKESAARIPAVANANMLINQLCSLQEPFLSGTLQIKLEDAYEMPIEIPVLLNFKETNGTGGIVFSVDQSSKTVIVTNGSSFDLVLSRAALVTTSNITVIEVGKTLSSGQNLSIPLPINKPDLNIVVDTNLQIKDSILKTGLSKYLQFDNDAQNTQYTLGVNGSGINFEDQKIDHIDVQISVTGLPQLVIPSLTLTTMHNFDSTTIIVPLDHAMGILSGTLLFKLHFTDRADTTFTLTNDFVHYPIFVVNNSDLKTQ
jgi:hypothetical protein